MNQSLFKNKKFFIIAIRGIFSGDGVDASVRLLKRYGSIIIGGLHLKMPDCIGDNPFLKKSLERNEKLIIKMNEKTLNSVEKYNFGKPTNEGLGFLSNLAG